MTSGGRRKSSGRPSATRALRSVLDTSRRGTSTRSHRHPGGGCSPSAPGRSTTTTLHCSRTSSTRSQVVRPTRGVAAHDEEKLGPGWARRSSPRVSAVYEGPPRSISSRLTSSPATPGGRLDHREPVLGRADGPFTDLLPGHIRDHQEDPVEREGVADVDRGHQVADVRRIEGPTEHAQSHGGAGYRPLERGKCPAAGGR